MPRVSIKLQKLQDETRKQLEDERAFWDQIIICACSTCPEETKKAVDAADLAIQLRRDRFPL